MVHEEKEPLSAVTGSMRDALRLDCVGIGLTIHPGSANTRLLYEELRALAQESNAAGLAVLVGSYRRGSCKSKEGEMGIDVAAWAANSAGV